MRVREKTAQKIAEIDRDIEWYLSLGDDYDDKVKTLQDRRARLQVQLDHYDKESAEGYEKPCRWRWKK